MRWPQALSAGLYAVQRGDRYRHHQSRLKRPATASTIRFRTQEISELLIVVVRPDMKPERPSIRRALTRRTCP